jgi:hypothetical protein
MASKITCAARGERDRDLRANMKPPSLAGVEKFIHSKMPSVSENAGENLLLKDDDDISGDTTGGAAGIV